jgi:hypothetical protein
MGQAIDRKKADQAVQLMKDEAGKAEPPSWDTFPIPSIGDMCGS